MALRSDELHYNLQHLNGMLTTHEAAKQLDLSYWHFMHLVEAGRIPGVRVVDRWLFSPADLDEYKRRRYGELVDLARTALSHPDVELTEKQATICRYLANSERPSAIARKLQQSRQAVYSQITLIREKVARILEQRSTADAGAKANQPSSGRKGRRQRRKGPIPLPTSDLESEPPAHSAGAETSESKTVP
ncbi:helix-turn-helix domain-containing protein [Thermogemmatispora sp.]|uniref:helix-turn-helix domain-containing protein n=1 Tax=Thermogemmatispora sp. TaxID=1968838 RepID=UPI0035E43CFB